MNGMIEVLFEIPSDILKGLQNGEFERIGGIIRKTYNKEIVLWLRDGQNLQEASKQSPQLLGQLNSLGLTPSMMVNVVSLGITVCGFIYLGNKLNKLDRKLDYIINELEEIREITGRISTNQEATYWAKLQSTIDTAESARLSDNKEYRQHQFLQSLNGFTGTKNLFFGILTTIGQKGTTLKYIDSFFQYLNGYQISALGALKSNLYLDQNRVAHHLADNTYKQLNQIYDYFQKSLNVGNPDFIKIPSNKIPELRVRKEQLLEASNRILSFREEIQYMLDRDISYLKWESMGNPKEPMSYLRVI